jgi:hypothetical protein
MAERDIIANLVVKGGEAFVQTVTQSAKAEEQLNKELNANTTAQQQNQKATLSARGELRQMREELIALARQGKANTAEYIKLRDAAGELADAIGDAGDEIRQAGSDTRGLDKALRAATVLTGAFTAVQGAAALFGKDSENLQKSLLKVQAALSVLNGLQAIQAELLRKDSIFTTALTRAKAAYSAAVAAATGATRGFTAALVATGIGAAVVAVGLLIANWDKLTAAFKSSKSALDEYNEAAEREKTRREQANKNISAAVAALEAQARELRAQGRIEEANAKQKLALERQISEAETNRINAQNLLLDAEKAVAEEQAKAGKETLARNNTVANQAKLQERLARQLDEVKRKEQEARNEVNLSIAALASARGALREYNNELGKEEIEKRTKAQEAANKANEAAKKAAEEAAKAAAAQRKEFDELFADLELLERRSAETIFGLSFQIGEINKQLQEIETGDPLGAVLIGNVIELEEKLNLVKLQLEAIRIIATGGDLQSIDVKVNTDEAVDSVTAARNALNDLFNQPRFGRDALGPSQEEIERERDRRIKIAQEIANASFQIFAQSQAAQQQVLDNKLRQGLITEEQYNEKVAELRRKDAIAAKAQAIFEASINLGVAITAALKKGLSVAAFTAALAAAQLAAIIATPIPRFFKGVKNFMGGLAWVGDGGKQEVVRTPSGQVSLTPDKPTLTYLPKGSDVFKDVPTFQREAGLYNMRTPSLSSLPASEEARERKEMVKLLKKGNAKYDEVVNLLMQNNKNTRQSVNELKTMNKPKRTFYV